MFSGSVVVIAKKVSSLRVKKRSGNQPQPNQYFMHAHNDKFANFVS